ncbi:MAG: hypothetical protein IJ115_08050 [Erysipelotrichaceae bacterium]|nr:hypothetical protein [Erysipelotrichaceae bacterium]
MKIEVSTPGMAVPIKIVLPNSLMKSKLLWKIAESNSDWKDWETVRQYQPLMVACYDALNRYIKDNGHFNLVEVSQPDGTKVIISL